VRPPPPAQPPAVAAEEERSSHRELSATHEIARFAFFDHFPYTKHVECGALLVRRPLRRPAGDDDPSSPPDGQMGLSPAAAAATS
jgi:hypothetical protein